MKPGMTFLLFVLFQFTFSQEIITIHNSVKDTISLDEKVQYYLFEDISTKDYLYSIVKINRNSDTILYHILQNDTIIKIITYLDISDYIKNINKIDAYIDYSKNRYSQHDSIKFNSLKNLLFNVTSEEIKQLIEIDPELRKELIIINEMGGLEDTKWDKQMKEDFRNAIYMRSQ